MRINRISEATKWEVRFFVCLIVHLLSLFAVACTYNETEVDPLYWVRIAVAELLCVASFLSLSPVAEEMRRVRTQKRM